MSFWRNPLNLMPAKYLKYVSSQKLIRAKKTKQDKTKQKNPTYILRQFKVNISTFQYLLYNNHEKSFVIEKFVRIYKTSKQCFQQKRQSWMHCVK